MNKEMKCEKCGSMMLREMYLTMPPQYGEYYCPRCDGYSKKKVESPTPNHMNKEMKSSCCNAPIHKLKDTEGNPHIECTACFSICDESPTTKEAIMEVVKVIMQEGFEVAMGGSMDLSEKENKDHQDMEYDQCILSGTSKILSLFDTYASSKLNKYKEELIGKLKGRKVAEENCPLDDFWDMDIAQRISENSRENARNTHNNCIDETISIINDTQQ